MNEEMKVLEKNKTWELVRLTVGKTSVGCKWFYTTKYQADKSIESYKVMLVSKGCTQTYEIDYLRDVCPVMKMNTIRILLSLVVTYVVNCSILILKCIFAWRARGRNLY